MVLGFTGERIVPGAADCEPTFAQKMYQEHLARYAFAAQFANAADVLDVGCGVGYGSQWLARAGARSVLGFDLSDAAIEHARMHYFHPAVSFKVQDATAIDAGDGYDLVTCFELIEHIAQQEHVLDLIKGALRQDGVLVISTPRPLDEIRTHFHVHEMNFEELYRMLKQRFQYVEPFFQVNCFTSFVGSAAPTDIDRIVQVTDRIGMANADYFVFLASEAPLSEKHEIQPTLSMNDDSYILTLEKDVGVLRNAESAHVARIADLERSTSDLTVSAERGRVIEQIHQDIGIVRATVEHLRGEQEKWSAIKVERDAAYQRMQHLERALAEVSAKAAEREHMQFDQAAAEAEVEAVRRVLADTSAKLAGAETEAFALRQEAGRLPDALARISSLENELNALRYRFEQSEATLMRFRRSLSWALTRPVRWFGRTFLTRTGRSSPNE